MEENIVLRKEIVRGINNYNFVHVTDVMTLTCNEVLQAEPVSVESNSNQAP